MPAHLTVDISPPSAVFIYSPRSSNNLKPPLSPTSSIKGCFVRSRPTSTDFDYEYSQLPNLAMDQSTPSESGNITTPTTSVSSDLGRVSHATEQWALAQIKAKDSDTRSLAPSALTCTDRRPVVPVRIIRRSDADMDKETAKMAKERKQLTEQNLGANEDAIRARRRTWPSYKAIRKTVSNILHRKDTLAPASPKGAKDELPSLEPPAGRVKSSSASMFTKRRRATVSDGEKKREEKSHLPIMHRAASSRSKIASNPFQHKTQLRRSRSFSGFTNVLTVIDDAEDDLDELTTEARGVVLDIRRRWDFEDVPEDAAMMFERCIE